MTTLFDPLSIGDLQLPNRVVMAPLTRLRAPGAGRVPNRLMAQYYAQRASAGLIITEGVPVSPEAVGYPNVPGIWTDEQVQGWRLVTQAVHAAGGRIFAQLWHVGRISDPEHLEGQRPVAPSEIAASGNVSLMRPKRPYVVPRALTLSGISRVIDDFARGARNARLAGFDGVTIHGANGYLLDQFLQDGTNQRTDPYGGSLAKRARLMLEVTDVVSAVWGPQRVGMHLAPRSPSHSVSDSDPVRTFTHIAAELGDRKLGFLFVRETQGAGALLASLKRNFRGAIIANDGFDRASAEAIVEKGDADAVSFGRAFIANPDLVERFRDDRPLNVLNTETIYDLETSSGRGYIDYPRWEAGLQPGSR